MDGEIKECPNCKSPQVSRDEVSVVAGYPPLCGPFGCVCGWSEYEEYNQLNGPTYQDGCRTDQWGGLYPEHKERKHDQ